MSTIDVTLGFFNDLVASKEQEIGGQVMIVEADGKILSRNARLNGDVVLGNLSAHADYPSPAPLPACSVKPAARRSCAPLSRIRGGADPLLQAIEGTPWLLATALPTSLLTQDSRDVLTTLASIQLPLVGLLFVDVAGRQSTRQPAADPQAEYRCPQCR